MGLIVVLSMILFMNEASMWLSPMSGLLRWLPRGLWKLICQETYCCIFVRNIVLYIKGTFWFPSFKKQVQYPTIDNRQCFLKSGCQYHDIDRRQP